MTTFAYTRVSTAEQTNGTSLADQETRIAGAAALLALPTPTVISDPGVSGSVPLADRPGGFELMQRAGRGDTILALKLDRLFRSATDALVVSKELKERGVSLILLDMGNDPVNGDGVGRVMFTIMAAFAELERTRIAERVTAGKAVKRAAGGYLGGVVPFGYARHGLGRDSTLQPDPQTFPVLETIQRGHRAGMSLRQIKALVASMHPAVKVSHVTIGKVIERAARS